MIYDGFLVLSNTYRTWFYMFFIKKRKFWVFQENFIRLLFDRSPKSSENYHFRYCEICYWLRDVSDEPKGRIRRKNTEYQIFCFRLSVGKVSDFGIQSFVGRDNGAKCTKHFAQSRIAFLNKNTVLFYDFRASSFWATVMSIEPASMIKTTRPLAQ